MTFDVRPVDLSTASFLATGKRVMNGFLIAPTEQAHARALLSVMDPPQGAVVLDAGCGVGAVAEAMRGSRPDLQFKLLNLSETQLAHCPEGMDLLHASFDAVPLPDGSVDVVMFNFALCHSDDWQVTLREARRVLKPSGMLFIYDMARRGGDNSLMMPALQASAYPADMVVEEARRAGFALRFIEFPTPVSAPLKELVGPAYDALVGDVVPLLAGFDCAADEDPVESAFNRHARVGFQFSGGRDSTAALYLLRPYWNRMRVYHLDTGDQFPETKAVVAQVEADMGRPMELIVGDVAKVRREYGLASDLVPVDNTELGRHVSGHETKIIGRYECCAKSLMLPMHERMRQDGVTLIVRGQRDDEYATPPKRSGDLGAGFEVLYPIQSWSAADVDGFIAEQKLPVAPFYARGMKRAPECMGCTAWWDEGRAAYLRDYHPVKFVAYQKNMRVLRKEIAQQMSHFQD